MTNENKKELKKDSEDEVKSEENANYKKQKPIYKTSIVNEYGMCEMAYNKKENRTYYVAMNKETKQISDYEKYIINKKDVSPLPPDHMLLTKNVILFPEKAEDYGSEDELLEDIQNFIHKYLDISLFYEKIATYYVLLTWLYDKFNEIPYLRTIGDYGSGKSRFLQTIGSLCYKPIFTGGATTVSPIFRILDETNGTLVMDESDFRFSDMTSDMIKILNTGYQKGMSVLRSEGKGVFEVKAYNVYSPKIIATRELFKDQALESRFLVEEMGNGKVRDDVPISLDEEFHDEAQKIRNKMLKWRLDNFFEDHSVKGIEKIKNIHPRLNQIIVPLLSIIKSDEIKKDLRKFIIKYHKNLVADRGLSWESDIVYAILKIKHSKAKTEMTMKEISEEVNFEMDIGESITSRKIGWYVRNKLQLKTDKKRNGFVLSTIINDKKLMGWKDRFGITDKELEIDD